MVIDNLCNSSKVSLDRVAQIVNLSEEEREKRLIFYKVDMTDEKAVRQVFENAPTFAACVHFAGLKVRVIHKLIN